MPIPDLSNKPGPGRPGYPTGGSYDFQFEVTGDVTFKAIANSAGTFSISYPDGTTTTTSGSSSITSQGGAGIISINKEDGDTTFCDEFAIVGNKDRVIKVISWGQRTWNKLQDAFKDCTNLTEISTTSLTTDNIGNLNNLFSGCTSLTDVSIKGWNLLSGCSIEGLFDGCTNIEKLEATGLALKTRASSRFAFRQIGSNVANGCEFLMSGLDFSTSTSMNFGDTFERGMFQQAKIKPNSNFSNWNLTSSVFIKFNYAFASAKLLGDNSTLNVSNWTFAGTTSSTVIGFFQNLETSDSTNRGLNVDITNWNFGNIFNLSFFFSNCDLSTVTGLSTLTASNLTNIEKFFQVARFLSIPSNDNFSLSFRNAINTTSMSEFGRELGVSLANESDWGVFPNLDGANLSNCTNFYFVFTAGRYSTGINLGNTTFSTNAVNYSYMFSGIKLTAGNGVDLSTTTLKSSNFSNMFSSVEVDFVKMGTGIDWTNVTSIGQFDQGANIRNTNGIELPTGLNLSSLNNLYLWGINSNYSQCQIDNFIRSMWLYQRPPLPSTPTLNFTSSTGLTAAPMDVRSKVDDLITAGWNFNTSTPDITAPFAYTGSFLTSTDITPTINTSGGTFSSSDVTVNATTGTFNTSTAGSVTIRYTITATGCYNEQVLSVVPPFTPFKFRVTGPISIKAQPAVAGQSFTIDWGDGSTPVSTTGGTSIPSNFTTAGTYDVQINAQGDNTYCDEFAIVSGQTNVTQVLDWGETAWNKLDFAFENCSNLTSLSNTSLTTASFCSFVYAFHLCTSLQSVDLRNWNLSQGVNLSYCFWKNYNLEEIEATNSTITISISSTNAFSQVGTQTANGCLFKMSGVDLSSSTSGLLPNTFYGSKIKKDSTFANWVFPNSIHERISFRLAVLPMQDSTLDCSGWTTYSATNLPDFQQVNYSYNGYAQPPTSSTGLKIDITNLNVSSCTTVHQCFYYGFQDEVVGLSTLGATNGATSMSIMFAYDKFHKFTATNNFSNTFISSLNLTSSNALNETFRAQGSSVPDVDAGVAPNLSGLDLSNINTLPSTFFQAKYSNALDFTNVTMNASTNYSFSTTFRGCRFLDGGNVNSLFSKTFGVSSLNQTFRDSRMGSIIFGSNIDLSTNDTLSLTFYEFGLDIASPTIEFADNVSFANVQNFDRPFYNVGTTNTPLSTCQVDNFIRRLQATRPTAGAITNKTIDFQNSSVTGSPSVVRGLVDTLVNTGGYILDLNSTDATIPFQYGTDLGPNTNITPTNNTGSAFTGTFTSSDPTNIPVVASGTNAGLINTSNTGSATIRYTLANGCFTEQAITISDPFRLRILVPAGGATFSAGTVGGSGYDYNIDWGDGNSTTGITTNSTQNHAYAAGTYFVKIYSNNKDGYGGFNANQSSLVQEVVSWGDLKWTSMQRSFYNCSNLTTLPSSFTLPLRSGAVGIRTKEAFRGCTNLNSVNLDGIKIYQDARYMFYYGLNNIQSFSMNNVEFHNAVDANSGGDMFTGFGSSLTSSWIDFNLNNWTFDNSAWCMGSMLGTTPAFNFANEEISISNWTFTNVPASSTMSFYGGYWVKGLARKGAASENFSLKLDNWTGTALFTGGVNFHTAMTNDNLTNFTTTNWDNNTKITEMYRMFYNNTGNGSEWIGLNQFMAHETPSSSILTQTFDLSEHKFNSASSSFNPNFLANITTNYSAYGFMKNISDASTQSVVEAQYSGYLDFLGSMNDKCTNLSNAFTNGHFKGPINFGSANLSGITSFLNSGNCTIYQDNKIDMSGVTIDGTTICNFQFMGASYGSGNGITLDFNSPNISFEGMTEFNLGHSYVGLINTYIMPPTITLSSTNFTGGLFISANSNYGKTMSTSDYGRLITAIATQTTHQNQSIRAAQNTYNGDPTLPSSSTSGPGRIGVNRTGVDYDGGTLNAIVTLESANLNMTSPPTGGSAASVGDLAISIYYTNNPTQYSDVTAIFTTNNTNDSFATSLDNFSSASSGTPYYVNILTSSVAAHIKTLVVNRGWTITDGEFDDNYQ